MILATSAGCMSKNETTTKSDQNVTAPTENGETTEPDIKLPEGGDENEPLPPPPPPPPPLRRDKKKRLLPPPQKGDDGEIIIPEPLPAPEK